MCVCKRTLKLVLASRQTCGLPPVSWAVHLLLVAVQTSSWLWSTTSWVQIPWTSEKTPRIQNSHTDIFFLGWYRNQYYTTEIDQKLKLTCTSTNAFRDPANPDGRCSHNSPAASLRHRTYGCWSDVMSTVLNHIRQSMNSSTTSSCYNMLHVTVSYALSLAVLVKYNEYTGCNMGGHRRMALCISGYNRRSDLFCWLYNLAVKQLSVQDVVASDALQYIIISKWLNQLTKLFPICTVWCRDVNRSTNRTRNKETSF